MPRILATSLTIILLLWKTTGADGRDGRHILLPGGSAASLGRGGTGVSDAGVNSFFLNPASIAPLERFEMLLGHGSIGGDYNNTGLAAAYPSSYGTFGMSFNSISTTSRPGTLRTARFLSIGGAKEFTDRLSVGAALDMLHGTTPDGSGHFIGAGLGARYATGFSHALGGGLGIFHPSLGVAGRAGVPFGGKKKSSDLGMASAGYGLTFYRGARHSIAFLNEIAAIKEAGGYPVKFGLESWLYDSYALRAGCTVPGAYGHNAISLGAGWRLSRSEFDARLDYSLGYHRSEGLSHFLGLTMNYGALDREPPFITIAPAETHISPNYDGRQDYVIFTTTVRDASRIRGWRLQILNPDGGVVREYRLSDRDMEERLTPNTFIKKIVQKKESTVVPQSVLWDGTDARGRVVGDGRYRYSFIVWDERDNISSARTGVAHVDTTAPSVELKSDDLLFSPNDDRNKDTLAIAQNIVTEPDDVWTAEFRSAAGNTIKQYRWTGMEVPRKIIWNGTTDDGAEAPEGLYSYVIECIDKAGNIARGSIDEITLTRRYETADATASLRIFSPAIHRELAFLLLLSSISGLEEWKLTIENADRKMVRGFSGTTALERVVKWNGADTAGKTLPDGRYYYTLATRFNSGNAPSSFTKEIIFDGTPPELSMRFSPSLFSPDGDGTNDILTLYPSASDGFGIARWSILIYSNAGDLFKSFSGQTDPAPEIKWDGLSATGEVVESAADYFIEMEAVDIAGNHARSRRLRLPIDVLVMVTERGLRIRISNIEFAFDSAGLTARAFPILGRVADILNRYRTYSIRIEGHTDDIGEEEYNLRLSEERAKAVMDHLITRGIARERLSFRGMGETAAFLPNTNAENRRRNRRVEFILIRDEAHE
ncbi:MAG TPA: OmpA family protein [Spirochaetota bacterium]|nr:OmpA family protein [Spirochaetota bacterium]